MNQPRSTRAGDRQDPARIPKHARGVTKTGGNERERLDLHAGTPEAFRERAVVGENRDRLESLARTNGGREAQREAARIRPGPDRGRCLFERRERLDPLPARAELRELRAMPRPPVEVVDK